MVDPLDLEFRRQLGNRLRSARLNAGMTLQSAGDRLGFTKQALGHWETAHNPIDVATLWRLARLYKTTLVALLADKLSNEDLLALTRRQLDESQPADTPPTQKGAKRAGRGK